jgi:hypothetical protein
MLTLPDNRNVAPNPSIPDRVWWDYWNQIERQGTVIRPLRRGYPTYADMLLSLLHYGNNVDDFVAHAARPLMGYTCRDLPLRDAVNVILQLTRILAPDCDSWTAPSTAGPVQDIIAIMWGNNLDGADLARINERQIPHPGTDAAATARGLILDGWETDFDSVAWHTWFAQIFIDAIDTANALHSAHS